MYRLWLAYLLWLVGGFGVLGFHRLYLRKIPTAVLWFLTGGLAFIGAAFDFLTLRSQVEAANRRDGLAAGRVAALRPPAPEKEPLERTVLRVAQQNAGRVSAVQVAAASEWTLGEVQAELDRLAKQGLCELRILKGGGTVYHFADFDPSTDRSFEV